MIYLDNAATTRPKPPAVAEAVAAAMAHYGNCGRGVHDDALAAARSVYAVREPVGDAAAEEPELTCIPDQRGSLVVAVDTDAMGRGSEELGRTLMKGFLFAVGQLPELPKTILFYNGGARLTTEGSDSLEDLKKMEAQGVEILTCGTCLNFYGLTDKLAVGSVTNMYTIVEKLAGAGKVIKP